MSIIDPKNFTQTTFGFEFATNVDIKVRLRTIKIQTDVIDTKKPRNKISLDIPHGAGRDCEPETGHLSQA